MANASYNRIVMSRLQQNLRQPRQGKSQSTACSQDVVAGVSTFKAHPEAVDHRENGLAIMGAAQKQKGALGHWVAQPARRTDSNEDM